MPSRAPDLSLGYEVLFDAWRPRRANARTTHVVTAFAKLRLTGNGLDGFDGLDF